MSRVANARHMGVKQAGYLYVYLSNENPTQSNVYFDDFQIRVTTAVEDMTNYYPFGLTYNSFKRTSSVTNRIKFQGQEHITELNLSWDSFKWRNHQPEIGRFFGIDPLAEKYIYNSPYAFSENKVIRHRELEGLESVDAVTFYSEASDALERAAVGVGNFFQGLFQSGSGIPQSAEVPVSQQTVNIVNVTSKPGELTRAGEKIRESVGPTLSEGAKALRKGLEATSEVGTVTKRVGAGIAIPVPEVGIPLMGTGQVIESGSDLGLVGLDALEGNVEGAAWGLATWYFDNKTSEWIKSAAKGSEPSGQTRGLLESIYESWKEVYSRAFNSFMEEKD